MSGKTGFRTCWSLLMVALGATAGCDGTLDPVAEVPDEALGVASNPWDAPVREPLTVMTRNVYLGGDIGMVLGADLTDPLSLMAAANVVWGQVQANDFRERAVALVDEIEAADPDFVGLQEAVQFIHVLLTPSGPEATVTDFVQILQEEIDGRGLPYYFLTVQDNTSVQVPLAGAIVGTGFQVTEFVQFTDREAVLVRDAFPVQNVVQGNFAATYSPGGDLVLKRGWIRVDADVSGTPHHFVTTHLEIQPLAPVQALQTQELVAGVLAGLDGVTILVGDMNSNAAGVPGDPTWTPTYDALLDAGFLDLWRSSNPSPKVQGLTCCNDGDLRNEFLDFQQRIDFVLYRASKPWGRAAHFPGPLAVEIVGTDPAARTMPNGLWPSDHAGLVAHLWGAPGLFK